MNVMGRQSYLCILLTFLLFLGCENSIVPFLARNERLVVFSILTTQSDTQFVRLQYTYSSPGNISKKSSNENSFSDVSIIVTDGTIDFRFEHLSKPQSNWVGNDSTFVLFFSHPFRPQENRPYTLTVTSPTLGTVRATTRVPTPGFINCITTNELFSPSRRPILVQFRLSDITQAQLIRFYLVYTTENPGDEGREHYVEVPAFWKILDLNYELHETKYPLPDRRTAPLSRRGQAATMTFAYEFPTYPESQYAIFHYNFNVRFKRAVFYLIQFDENWYKYYAAVNLFQDRLGVRLDPPDYSNIQGGYGLFGSFRVDSTVIPLPEYIRPYR